MSQKYRLLVFVLVLLIASTGCSQYSFGGPESRVESIDDIHVVRSMRYFDENTEGPEYTVSVVVPDGWVDEFETLNKGNSLAFRYLKDDDDIAGSPIFYLELLSNNQYWEQIGGFPGQFVTVLNTADTYFIYRLPPDAFYSGLQEEDFDAIAALVPEIMSSLIVARVD